MNPCKDRFKNEPMRISMECQPRALFPLLLVEDLPTEPPSSPAGARIIPPPEAATHLASNKLGMILDLRQFLKCGS